ncbi:hypothetical protein D3874_05040 [Oleomonas cavernae]|uniref:Orc1-like AAA ATPase domain-containing protein n=1 Tax=Oleomonas cavernae TaxID=2320859 RepID=A0A418W8X8_9PROT|nr:AAA family ATPase [Oleomonas cavernae]RJF86469.1 hypothetical protein D3874_05040 [Oleomonas cavernae]
MIAGAGDRGTLLGFDVSGFTRIVADLSAAKGVHGFEEATDRLGNGFRAVVHAGRARGYGFGDVLGDCLLLTRRATETSVPEIDDAEATAAKLAALFTKESGGFPVRSASCSGLFWNVELPLPLPGGQSFLTGPAVAELHRRLVAGAVPRNAVNATRWIGSDEAILDRKLGEASLARSIVAFCRIGGAEVFSQDDPRLIQAILLLADICSRHGGILFKVTQEAKGIIACMTFPQRLGVEANLILAFRPVIPQMSEVGSKLVVSISSGSVYSGPIEIDGVSRLTVHGMAVNRAAKRLAYAPSGIRLDRETAARARMSARLPVIRETPFVGRMKEIETIRRAAHEVSNGACRLIRVEGVAGVGKSRLLDVACEGFSATFACASVRCLAEDAHRPFEAAARLVGSLLFTLWQGSNPVAAFLEACADAGLARVLWPLAAQLLDIDAGLNEPVEPGPWQSSAKRQILDCLLLAALQRGQVAFVVDDYQWCDDETDALLRRTLQAGDRLLVLTAARPIERSSVAHEVFQDYATIKLKPLSESEAMVLYRAFLPPGHGTIESELIRLGNGNPLFLIQMANSATRRRRRMKAKRHGVHRRRPALTSIVEQRLSWLTRPALVALRLLSAAGIALPAQELEGLASRWAVGSDFPAVLDLLITEGLVVRLDAHSIPSFQVAHQLIALAVLKSMPKGAFRRINEHLARYAQRGSLRRRLPPALHAAYWRRCEYPARAAIKLGSAANALLSAGSYRASIHLFDRAEANLAAATVSAPCRVRRQIEWKVKRAQAYWGLGDLTLAGNLIDEALHLFGRHIALHKKRAWIKALGKLMGASSSPLAHAGNRARSAFLLAHSLRAELSQFKGETGPLIYSSLVSVILAPGNTSGYLAEARAYAVFTYILGLARLAPLRRALLAHANRRLAKSPKSSPAGYVAAATAVHAMAFGRWPEARESLALATALNRGPEEPHLGEMILTLEALTDHYNGMPEGGVQRFGQLGLRARDRGNVLHTAWGDYGRAQSLIALGRPEEAESLLTSASALLASSGDAQSRLIVIGLRAAVADLLGRKVDAVNLALEGYALARTIPPTNLSSLEGYARPAEILSKASNSYELPDDVDARRRSAAAPAVKLLERFGVILPMGRPRAHFVRALFERAKGNQRRSLRFARKAILLADTYGMPQERAMVERDFPDLARWEGKDE